MVLVDFSTGNALVAGDTAENPAPPEAAWILDLFQSSRAYFKSFRDGADLADEYISGEREVPVPVDMPVDEIRPATAYAIVQVAADHVDVSNPAISVPAPSPRAHARAERIQKFLQGAWAHIPDHVKRAAVKHSVAYGIGFFKTWWDGDKWPEAPREEDYPDEADYKEALAEHLDSRSITFPFVVDAISPRNLLWDDSRAGMKWAIEYYEAHANDVQRLYPEWSPLSGTVDTVTFKEYWDDTWCVRLIDDVVVWGPHRHGYGFMPYVPITPGTGIDIDVGPPERRYQSILKPVYNLLDAEARLVTQFESILRQYAWRTLDFKGPASSAQSTADAYELYASKNIVYPNVDVTPSPLAMPPQEILQQLGNVQTMIEEATFPNVVRGLRPSGVSSGFAVSVLAGTGRLVFGKYAEAVARGMETANQNMLKLVKNKARGRVTVHARSSVHNFDQAIGPDDIKSFIENSVALKAEAPEEREREALLARQLKEAGIISQYEAMRRAGIASPLEEQNQIAAEQLLEMVRPQQAEQVAQALALGEQRAQAADTTLGGPGGAGGAEAAGSRFMPGMPQLQRPGERNVQQARVAGQAGRESVFPRGQSGLDLLGAALSTPTGGGRRMPSGQRVS